MKALFKLSFLLLVISLSTIACKKEDENKESSSQTNSSSSNSPSASSLLTSKKWTSYKTFNSGVDVTGQSSSISYDFKSDNSYIASSSSGSSNGSWSLSGNALTLDGNSWSILELTASSLKIEDASKVVKIYFQ